MQRNRQGMQQPVHKPFWPLDFPYRINLATYCRSFFVQPFELLQDLLQPADRRDRIIVGKCRYCRRCLAHTSVSGRGQPLLFFTHNFEVWVPRNIRICQARGVVGRGIVNDNDLKCLCIKALHLKGCQTVAQNIRPVKGANNCGNF